MRIAAFVLSVGLVSVPVFAFAQEEGEAEATQPAAAPETAETEADVFEIRRGFFTEADLGVFFTLFGRNTNAVEFPTRAFSNVQPFLGITVGYDLFHGPSYNFAAGVKLAAGYSAGSGRASQQVVDSFPAIQVSQLSADYSVLQAGATIMGAYFLTDRIALTLKLDGGAGFVDPDPRLFAAEEGAGSSVFAPVVGGGIGVEYFTLLNDFSVGLDLRGALVLLSGSTKANGVSVGGPIPAMSISVPIKYTF